MLSLSLLFWLTLFAGIIVLWWQSDKVKALAMQQVQHHCRQLGLQLLDQTMVLRGIWPARNKDGNLALRRHYQFEFTVTGETRHKGSLKLLGTAVQSLQLEPHPLPDDEQNLH